MNKHLIEVLKLFLTKVSNSSSLQKYSLDVHIQSKEISIIAPIPAKESKTYKEFMAHAIKMTILCTNSDEIYGQKIISEVKAFEDKTMITIYIQNDK